MTLLEHLVDIHNIRWDQLRSVSNPYEALILMGQVQALDDAINWAKHKEAK